MPLDLNKIILGIAVVDPLVPRGVSGEALGSIVFVALPQPGDAVDTDTPIGELESTKAVSEVYAPVAGSILRVNGDLRDAPETINADLFAFIKG